LFSENGSGMKKGEVKESLFRFDEEVHDHKFKAANSQKIGRGRGNCGAAPKPSNVQCTSVMQRPGSLAHVYNKTTEVRTFLG